MEVGGSLRLQDSDCHIFGVVHERGFAGSVEDLVFTGEGALPSPYIIKERRDKRNAIFQSRKDSQEAV